MRMRSLTLALAVLIAAVSLAPVRVGGQAPSTAPKTAVPAKTASLPKTSWGDPDLQGVWTSDDMLTIPMQRPEQFAGRADLTDEEFADRSKRTEQVGEIGLDGIRQRRTLTLDLRLEPTHPVPSRHIQRIVGIPSEVEHRLRKRQALPRIKRRHLEQSVQHGFVRGIDVDGSARVHRRVGLQELFHLAPLSVD